MFTQSRDPEKTKPAYKKCCSCCHKTIPSISACFEKQRDDEDERRAHARSKFPQKSFLQYFRSPSNDRTKIMIHDIEVTITITMTPTHKTDIGLYLEIALVMIKVLPSTIYSIRN